MNKGPCVKAWLCPCSLAMAFGFAEAIFMVVLAWVAWLSGAGLMAVSHIATFYVGYSATFVGGLIGGLYGYFIGALFGLIVGLVYNFSVCWCKKWKGCCDKGACEKKE